MRIREAEFLLRRQEWDETWVTKDPPGRASRAKLLEAYALVLPCSVATVYKASQHCCFYTGEIKQPMDLPVDLLIFDEAGQVAPDLGLPLLGVARRSVAVGDVYQLEPIESFNEACDELLLRAEGIGGSELHEAHRGGLTHTRGSVMRAFQQATAYTDAEVEGNGVLLRDHFRCVPGIIAYCNDLVYNHKLISKKPCESAFD
jgi:superfamily I DNA and/or RNA helicase